MLHFLGDIEDRVHEEAKVSSTYERESYCCGSNVCFLALKKTLVGSTVTYSIRFREQ